MIWRLDEIWDRDLSPFVYKIWDSALRYDFDIWPSLVAALGQKNPKSACHRRTDADAEQATGMVWYSRV